MKEKVVKVKICGNKRIEDALQAERYGADAIGLLVGPENACRDFISPIEARNIARQLPPFCNIVLATPLTDVKELTRLAKFIGVNTIQLHGDSMPEDIIEIRKKLPHLKIIKSLHIIDGSSVVMGKKYADLVDAILVDTFDEKTKQIGGTGKTHNWDISKRIVEEYNVPVILAGGLTCDNVAEAIKAVKPYGVDVNSGTKGVDGFKDYRKIELFIKRAKSV